MCLSLAKVLTSDRVPHAFLFTGPSGTGKTTLARIVAREIGVPDTSFLELDAATYSGIDVMRDVTSGARYAGFGDNPRKAILIDECHALSKATWQSLLLSIEEPPEHVYWMLCTTEDDKVPKTIRTRCHAYELKSVKADDIADYLEQVAVAEGIETTDTVVGLIARKADGSVRQALQYLSMVDGVEAIEEAQGLISSVIERPEIVDLAKALIQGKLTWTGLTKTLKELDEQPESIRMVMVNFVGAYAMNARNEQEAGRLLAILDAFREPYRPNEKMAPLLLSFGRLLIGE